MVVYSLFDWPISAKHWRESLIAETLETKLPVEEYNMTAGAFRISPSFNKLHLRLVRSTREGGMRRWLSYARQPEVKPLLNYYLTIHLSACIIDQCSI